MSNFPLDYSVIRLIFLFFVVKKESKKSHCTLISSQVTDSIYRLSDPLSSSSDFVTSLSEPLYQVSRHIFSVVYASSQSSGLLHKVYTRDKCEAYRSHPDSVILA